MGSGYERIVSHVHPALAFSIIKVDTKTVVSKRNAPLTLGDALALGEGLVPVEELTAGHLGAVVYAPEGADISVDGMIIVRISHEKRFRTGVFIGLSTQREYEKSIATNTVVLQRSGLFLPATEKIGLEFRTPYVPYADGTAGASKFSDVGYEAYFSHSSPWRKEASTLIDHSINEGTAYIYTDADGMLDPDHFGFDDRIEKIRH